MGGRIVLEAALAAPDRVSALVLMDAVLDGVPWDPESERGMQAVQSALSSGGVAAARAAWLQHGFFRPAQRRPEVARQLATMVADYSGVHWTEPDPHGAHPDGLASLSTLAVPTTVIVGERDVPCFLTMANVLADGIPGARKVVVPDAGHMVNMESPDLVDSVLSEVVLELSSRGRAAARPAEG